MRRAAGAVADIAATIRNDRVVAAGCILPPTQDPRVSQTLGTRHRAAMGMTEETDAFVIVVSEETGTIAWAEGGKLHRKVDANALREALLNAFGATAPEEKDATAAPAAA